MRWAACQVYPSHWWLHKNHRSWGYTSENRVALLVCGRCPVRNQCLEFALASEIGEPNDHRWGIYGGLTPKQRADLAKRRRGRVIGDD